MGVALLMLLGLSYLAVLVPQARRENISPFPRRTTAPYSSEASLAFIPRRLSSAENSRPGPEILRPADRDNIPRRTAGSELEGRGQTEDSEAMEAAGLMLGPEDAAHGPFGGVPGLSASNPGQIAGSLQGSPGSGLRLQEGLPTSTPARVGARERQGDPLVVDRRGRTGGTVVGERHARTGRAFSARPGPASAPRWGTGLGTAAAGAATPTGAPSPGETGASARVITGHAPADQPPGGPVGPAALAPIPDPGPPRPAAPEPVQAPRPPPLPAEPADMDERMLTLADLEAAYRRVDADKVRDAARLLGTAGLDPAGFTLVELKRAGGSAGWMTQRSKRDIEAVVKVLDAGP